MKATRRYWKGYIEDTRKCRKVLEENDDHSTLYDGKF